MGNYSLIDTSTSFLASSPSPGQVLYIYEPWRKMKGGEWLSREGVAIILGVIDAATLRVFYLHHHPGIRWCQVMAFRFAYTFSIRWILRQFNCGV